ncbi:hypothetical protein APY94_07915 [Thermococcus celericrescens]|uniref:Uncharacterized protein n=1 Tax=Thermococcus celericrescens TaxID=227598 RepID=A0A100XXB3_9EURY|nr:hypothetical protein [Thermococcus celericrescens]KUH32962.1 hypothetical protein APY94_07915 [Thermococcus celericrescens]
MKLPRRKCVVALAIAGIVLLTVVQWWSYRQVGEVLENYPLAGTMTGYVMEKRPLVPHLYVSSLRGRIVGYRHDPDTRRYLVVVEGKMEGSRKSEEYLELLGVARERYFTFLNITAEELTVWWNTKNESYLNRAAFDLAHSLPWKVELSTLERSENRTLVIVEPPYPYAVLYSSGSAWYLGTSLLLIALAIYLLHSASEVVEFVSRRKTWLGVLLVGLLVFASLRNSREDPLMSLGPMWWTSDGDCTYVTYAVVRNEKVDDVLIDAIKMAKDWEVYGRKRARTVVLLLSPDEAENLVGRLKEVTTVKAVSVQLHASRRDEMWREALVPAYLDLLNLYGDVLPDEAFVALFNVSKDLVGVESVIYPNCGDMRVVRIILEG